MDPYNEDGGDHDVYSSKSQRQTLRRNVSRRPPMETYGATVDGALLGKVVVSCSHGRLVLLDVNTKILSLCNSTTFRDAIILPKLHQLSKFKIDSCILLPNQSSGGGNFKVLVFLENHKTVMCCRVAVDEKWRELGYWNQLKPLLPIWVERCARDSGSPLFLGRAVACGGKIYAALCAEWLCCFSDIWCIEMVEEPIGLVVLSKLSMFRSPPCPGVEAYLLESRGELFPSHFINRFFNFYERRFDNRGWNPVTNPGDRAFFIVSRYCLSCPVSGDGCVYFFDECGSLCCYYMHDESVLVRKPMPSLALPQPRDEYMSYSKGRNIGAMDESRQRKLSTAIEASHGNMSNHQLDEGKRSERSLSDLPNEVINEVMIRLIPKARSRAYLFPFDYMNFRAVSRSFLSLCPRLSWRDLLGGSDFSFPFPFLMFADRDQKLTKFVDPRGVSNSSCYLMRMFHEFADPGSIRCSFQGCFIYCKSDSRTIHLRNPFTRDHRRFYIPVTEYERNQSLFYFSGCLFSVGFFGTKVEIAIFPVTQEESPFPWGQVIESNMVFEVKSYTNPVLFEDSFYYMDDRGHLGKLEIDLQGNRVNFAFEVLEKPSRPHSAFVGRYRFLVKCGGNLISVFVGYMGEFVAVYKLSDCKQVWEAITTLGDYNLYLSNISSFSSCCDGLGGRNRIYLPSAGRSESELTFFSLETGKWHFSGSQDSCADDLYGARIFTNSCWIMPSFQRTYSRS